MTISTCFNPAINPREILGRIKELLNRVNPQFSEEEKKYTKATKKLRKAVSNTIPSVEEYLATLEEIYGYELLYICWQGFQYNLDCFNAPVNALLLQGDYEILHRERRLHTLPHTQKARMTVNAFHEALKGDGLLELTDDISDFYTTIEVEGYKIAHYLGFLFADHFLPLVIPGYTPDSVITNTYAMLLSRATGFNLVALESEIYQEYSKGQTISKDTVQR